MEQGVEKKDEDPENDSTKLPISQDEIMTRSKTRKQKDTSTEKNLDKQSHKTERHKDKHPKTSDDQKGDEPESPKIEDEQSQKSNPQPREQSRLWSYIKNSGFLIFLLIGILIATNVSKSNDNSDNSDGSQDLNVVSEEKIEEIISEWTILHSQSQPEFDHILSNEVHLRRVLKALNDTLYHSSRSQILIIGLQSALALKFEEQLIWKLTDFLNIYREAYVRKDYEPQSKTRRDFDEDVLPKLKSKVAVVLLEIEKLARDTPLSLQDIFEVDSSPANDAIMLATLSLTSDDIMKGENSINICQRTIEKRLTTEWLKDGVLKIDQITPILSRITGLIVCL